MLCSSALMLAECCIYNDNNDNNYNYNYYYYYYYYYRQPLRSAGTNRLAVPPVNVANQPGFPGCRPTDMERSARRRDFSQIVIHLPSAT